MSGINAIGSFDDANMHSLMMYGTAMGQKLTAATKAKLNALGVDTTYIRTESEGRSKLKTAQMERTRSNKNTEKLYEKGGNEEIMKYIERLALKLGYTIKKSDDLDYIIYQLSQRIKEITSSTNQEDKQKMAEISGYWNDLSYIKTMQKSGYDLIASLSVTANNNIAFHGL